MEIRKYKSEIKMGALDKHILEEDGLKSYGR